MSREFISPPNVHQPRGYSHVVKVGNTIYISGQVGVKEDGQVAPGGFQEQARQALENLKRVLAAAGATTKDIVKLNTYVTTTESLSGYRELRQSYFGEHAPASTLLRVAGLASPDFLIEIEAIAVLD